MKKRSRFTVVTKLIGLVKPLTAYMALAVIMGIVGHLCASFITIFGGFAVLDLVGVNVPFSLTIIFISLAIFFGSFVRRFVMQSRRAIILSHLNFWLSYEIKYFKLLESYVPPN